jgi:hypothetical protein
MIVDGSLPTGTKDIAPGWFEDAMENAFGVLFIVDGSPDEQHVGFQLGTYGAPGLSGTCDLSPFAAEHEIVCQYLSGTTTLELYIDDVFIGSCVQAPDPAMLAFGMDAAMGGGVVPVRLVEVQAGLGRYPG